MPLTLVLGPANSAKAGEVLGGYSAAAGRGALLVVPTRADALFYDRELAGNGLSPGRALTFEDLLEEIALRAGYEQPRLSGLARDLLIRRVITETRLEFLAESALTPGFPVGVGRLLATLSAQRVGARRLAAAAATAEDGPSGDIARILRRYRTALDAIGAKDAEGHAWGALDALRAAPRHWGETAVYLYGFDDLTRIEADAVETLAHVVGVPVTVSLTFEEGRAAFAGRAGAVEHLRTLADEVRVLPAQERFYAHPALHHLERHLFEEAPPASAAGDAITLLEAGGARAEAELVAAEVLEALRGGIAPEEVVVVCRSLRRSGALLERALHRYGVPTMSARSVPFTHTALGRGLAALLTGDAITYLRLTRPLEEVDTLQASASRSGRPVQTALPPLGEALAALLPRATGAGLTPEEELDVRAAAVLKSALEELGELTPPEMVALLERLEVSSGGAGGILVAEPLSIRARRFRHVIVTGLCEGEFPQAGPADPFLPEERRRRLALGAGLTLEPPPDPLAAERYLLYACLSRASERVTVSFRSADEDGNAVAPSVFLEEIRRLFPDLPQRRRLLSDVIWSASEAPTAREFALARAEAGGEEPGGGAPQHVIVGAGAEADAGGGATRKLGTSALAHVRHAQRVSPGAMERFALCPVAWLVERQLAPENLEPEPEPLVKGTLMHDLLARIVGGEPGVLEGLVAPVALAPGEPAPVREAILTGIRAELAAYLAWEADHQAAGFTPEHLEFPFTMTLAAGLEVVGTIDRVDVDAEGRAIVRDYKSGRDAIARAGSRWVSDHTFQVGLYMLAVERVLALTPVGGVYQPLAGRDLRPRGAALASAGLPLRANDVLEPDELAALLTDVEAEVDRLAATLARGELTPCPASCSPDGCRHPGICWATQ